MALPAEQDSATLVRLVRDEGPRVLATLVRTTGSLPLAQDAVQDAVVRALETWPRTGVPTEPRAWLTLTARRRAIDLARREQRRAGKETEAMALSEGEPEPAAPSVVRDDLLRLIFTCCHPSLDLPTQTALALRTLCGLTTAEVGRALLVEEAAMAKRLTRARRKIAAARIPYRVPTDDELPDRLRGALATVYLLFNEGYAAGDGPQAMRPDLCDQALRLARLLLEVLPDEAGVQGLMALILLTEARRPARFEQSGAPVLLADQDRTTWDASLIREGVELVGRALQRTADRPDPYVVQAAIAACHDLAASWDDTDWGVIVSWYDVLVPITRTPVVQVNRAVALAELHGPERGLVELDEITLPRYPPLAAARAELLLRAGRSVEAAAAYDVALSLPLSEPVRAHLLRRRATLTG